MPTTSTRSRSLATVDDALARAEVDAERAFLEQLGGGCNLPCGTLATARRAADGTTVTLEIEALLASLDGRLAIRARATGADPATVGREVATRLLDEYGGRALLEDVA